MSETKRIILKIIKNRFNCSDEEALLKIDQYLKQANKLIDKS